MKTAVIYARYSSDSQTEQSIDGQLRVCKEYAEKNDIIILDTYIDRAMTGTNDNRPDFQRMIKDSNKKAWNYVLVYKLDRFSRNKYETTIHKHTLLKNGVKVLSAMENIPDTPEGIILESLLEGMNQYYSAELAQKIKRGMHETRLKGNYQGGSLLYGYKVNGRKIVVDETKVDIIKFIFEQYSTGVFVKDIIAKLNQKGIFNNGKPFTENRVYRMLKNEKYLGRYTFENELIENMYPRIISDELFAKVKKITTKNYHGKRSMKSTFLLRHKLKCGYCGYPISAECGIGKNGTKNDYYKCYGRKKKHNNCIKTTLRKNELETFIIDNIIEELSKPNNINAIVKNLIEYQNNIEKENFILKQLYKEQKQTQTALDNLVTALEHGIMNHTTNKRMKELEVKLADLEKQILIEKSKATVKLTEEEIKRYYTDALKLEPLVLINYLINSIKLYNDKIEIKFNTPINRSPDFQGFYFLSKSKKIFYNYEFQYITLEMLI